MSTPSTRDLIVSAARAGASDHTLTSLVDLHIAEQQRAAHFRPPVIAALWDGLLDVQFQLGVILRRVGRWVLRR
jgi:hypothetical protein